MIKLYNNSKIDSSIWLPILREAKRKAKVKGTIVVLITASVRGGGLFNEGFAFRDNRFKNKFRRIKSDAGKVIIKPFIIRLGGEIYCAEVNCKTILHEFRHAYDYQQGKSLSSYKDGKKLQHDYRPCEIRANYFMNHEAKVSEELLLKLAIEIERIQKSVL